MIGLLNTVFSKKTFTKILLFGIIFFLGVSINPALAQTESDTGVSDPILRYGAKIGYTSSAFSDDYESFTDTKKGFLVGGFVHYRVFGWLTGVGDVTYQQQGAANFNSIVNGPVSISTNVIQHNIDLSALGMVTVPEYDFDSFIPFLTAGIAYGFNMKSYHVNKTRTVFDDGSSFKVESFQDASHKYKQNDMAIVIGTGFMIKTSGWAYKLDIRYRAGLTNINNIRPDNPGNDFSSNVTTVSVGIAL